ncbi:hypothetical protein FQA47_001049 [Oryzias melastigma]|uniref:Uncharacterized protein n=1 Tax=Oryzias melastigma TaxID=30732 RepID=A0A834FNM1_ORYME|nr:hypothetical protein FQA47_001049 [Oryzias melastigma]
MAPRGFSLILFSSGIRPLALSINSFRTTAEPPGGKRAALNYDAQIHSKLSRIQAYVNNEGQAAVKAPLTVIRLLFQALSSPPSLRVAPWKVQSGDPQLFGPTSTLTVGSGPSSSSCYCCWTSPSVLLLLLLFLFGREDLDRRKDVQRLLKQMERV